MNIPLFEQQLIIAHILGVSREYVLAHPEIKPNKTQEIRYQKLLKRRQNNEPLAYILGHKEFYGLDFKVTPATLIPRPETELLVELASEEAKNTKQALPPERRKVSIIDIGTGSGNIIISISCNTRHLPCQQSAETQNKINFYGVDNSTKALAIANQNAKQHKLENKIKFIKSNLLEYFINHPSLITNHCIIVANLPYLSKEIYSATMPDVKNFEPRSALLSGTDGLEHYKKLLSQINQLKSSRLLLHVSCFLEFSPEQKHLLQKLIRKYFPTVKIIFHKDLAGKWRVVEIKI